MSLRQDVVDGKEVRLTTRLDAVLRVGAPAAVDHPEWLRDANEQLQRERREVGELEATIAQLRRQMVVKDIRHATKLAKATVKAAECARKVQTLQADLNARARRLVRYLKEKGDFDRSNEEIVEAINALKLLCEGYVPYEGPAYVDDFGEE